MQVHSGLLGSPMLMKRAQNQKDYLCILWILNYISTKRPLKNPTHWSFNSAHCNIRFTRFRLPDSFLRLISCECRTWQDMILTIKTLRLRTSRGSLLCRPSRENSSFHFIAPVLIEWLYYPRNTEIIRETLQTLWIWVEEMGGIRTSVQLCCS